LGWLALGYADERFVDAAGEEDTGRPPRSPFSWLAGWLADLLAGWLAGS